MVEKNIERIEKKELNLFRKLIDNLSQKSDKKPNPENFPKMTAQSFLKTSSQAIRDLNTTFEKNYKRKNINDKSLKDKIYSDIFLQSAEKAFVKSPALDVEVFFVGEFFDLTIKPIQRKTEEK